MNPDNIFQFVQTGFRVTVGATTSFFEGIQDTQKREHITQLLQTDFNQLVKEFADKGEITEQDARKFVETVIMQQTGNNSTSNQSNSIVIYSDFSSELRELTNQISSLRNDLEKMRNS